MKFCWKAEKRNVLIVPGPVLRTLALSCQSPESAPPVIPAFANACPATVEKLITAESKVKSPWNPMRFFAARILVVVTS